MPSPSTQPSDLEAARRGLGWIDRSDHGLLQVTGPDRISLIQRITSNDLKDLKAGRSQRNCFTSAKGKVIDWSRVLLGDDEVTVITSPGRGPEVQAWLDRYTIIEDLAVRDASASHRHVQLVGAAATRVAEQIAGAAPDRNAFSSGRLGPAEVTLVGIEPLAGAPSFWMITPSGEHDGAMAALLDLAPGAVALDNEATRALRVEAGMPESGAEVDDTRTPLEVGLWNAVSFDKGCYVGQEVLARMRNYDKVMTYLVQLELDDAAPAGTELFADGKPVGRLTSVSGPPWLDRTLALAFLKRRVVQAEQEVRAGDGDAAPIARVRRVIKLTDDE